MDELLVAPNMPASVTREAEDTTFGLYRDNGTQNGNYYITLGIVENIMQTTIKA